jgi:hypothetical protein
MLKKIKENGAAMAMVAVVVTVVVLLVVSKKNADGSRTLKANLLNDKKATA